MKQMQRILEKLNNLRTLDKDLTILGADEHKYKMKPVVSEADVKQWEKENKVKLPAEYRWFITNIGNGGAGPHNGLEAFDLKPIAGTFPFVYPAYFSMDENLDNFSDKYEDEDKASEKASEYETKISNKCENTSIPLCYEGCGISIVMAVKGKAAGSMWTSVFGNDGGGIFPFDDSDISFSKWYENWLDNCINILTRKDKKPEPVVEEKPINLATATLDNSLNDYLPADSSMVEDAYSYFGKREDSIEKATTYQKWATLFISFEKVTNDLTQLESLRLQHYTNDKKNPLTGIWPAVSLPNLKHLFLDDELQKLPVVYDIDDKKLPALESLAFYTNKKQPERMDMLKKFKNLKQMFLPYVGDVEVFDYLGESVEYLYMTDYRSKSIADIVKLKNLETIIIHGINKPLDFNVFTKLPKLRVIDISHPKGLGNILRIADCPSLETVVFHACYFDNEEVIEKLRERGRNFSYAISMSKCLTVRFAE